MCHQNVSRYKTVMNLKQKEDRNAFKIQTQLWKKCERTNLPHSCQRKANSIWKRINSSSKKTINKAYSFPIFKEKPKEDWTHKTHQASKENPKCIDNTHSNMLEKQLSADIQQTCVWSCTLKTTTNLNRPPTRERMIDFWGKQNESKMKCKT